MDSTNQLFLFLCIGGILIATTLVIIIVAMADKIKFLRSEISRLLRSLEEMDEQAKLIVRTDIELNKTQEELDKKVTGLFALQRLSRAVSTTLEEQQIFRRLESNHLEDLGFERACVFLMHPHETTFTVQTSIGYSPEETNAIKIAHDVLAAMYEAAVRGERTISSKTLADDYALKDKITGLFRSAFFVVSPILPKDGTKGMLIVGTEEYDAVVSEGDEELITILANQIGQALENARLFENTWQAQHALEKKVEERTRELSQALAEVKAVSKRKTDFISSVSHELRTPLTSIKGYAALLLTGKLGEIPKDVRERLDKINRHSDELVHMVNDLLDIARIESGRAEMKKESLSLSEVIAKVSDMLAVHMKERHIQFGAQVAPDANTILADKTQFERVLINLVNNAMKFTPAHGSITIDAAKKTSAIEISVHDTGCGIPEDSLKAIFEEFYRVENSINQEVKGTGLGLPLVKQIIEAHGGKIWVTSTVGAGSTFTFTIPQQIG